MKLEELVYEKKNGIAMITLNRPEILNAYTFKLETEWTAALDDANKDPEVKVVVVTGSGRAFCSGGNPRELLDVLEKGSPSPRLTGPARFVYEMDKPYIGAINGATVGGGMDMASLCDLRIASEQARFSMAYVMRMGTIPGGLGCYLLPRIVGLARALDLVMTGRMIDAQEALRIGYVNIVVPHQELMPTVMELAQQMARGPSVALGFAKRMLYSFLDMDMSTVLKVHAWSTAIVESTEDAKEGPRAWIEKREPIFRGL